MENEQKQKLRLDLVPVSAITAIGKGLTVGLKKHGEREYLEHVTEDELYAKTLRHLLAWRDGKVIDDGDGGTGLPHLYCVITNMAMLIDKLEPA